MKIMPANVEVEVAHGNFYAKAGRLEMFVARDDERDWDVFRIEGCRRFAEWCLRAGKVMVHVSWMREDVRTLLLQ